MSYQYKPQRILLAGHYRNWRIHPADMQNADLDANSLEEYLTVSESSKLSVDMSYHSRGESRDSFTPLRLIHDRPDTPKERFCFKCKKHNWACCRECTA